MSGITSGVGLISGLPTADLIDSIIAAESRPQALLNEQLQTVQTTRGSLLELNARLLALGSTVSRLKEPNFFQKFASTSSNEDVLTATASDDAAPGVVDLVVKSLVTSHQMISGGFADADETPVGVGQVTIEIGEGKLNAPTSLGDLNGSAGVRRGVIEITDRSGAVAKIDLTAVVTLTEVLEAINSAAEIDVTASVDGNHLVVRDNTDGTGTLIIADVGRGFAAADLGIRQSGTDGAIVGEDIYYLSDASPLSLLNDGNGVRRGSGDDFRITTGAGSSFSVRLDGTLSDDTNLAVLNNGNGVRVGTLRITNRVGVSGVVDLTGAVTVGDVRSILAAATDENGTSLQISANAVGIGGVGSMTIEDGSEPPERPADVPEDEYEAPELIIEDVTGYAARDLGIAGADSDGSMVGSGIHRVSTMGDVVRAINYAVGNDGAVVASLTDNGIHLEDTTVGGGEPLEVEALTDGRGGLSRAAFDLGIEGVLSSDYESRQLLAGLNTVLLTSLNGGAGVELGSVSFQPRDGSAAVTVDFTGAQTVQDLIARINQNVPGIEASLNSVGHGIALTDTTGAATGSIVVSDVGGTLAETLGLAGTFTAKRVEGVNLQRQYLNELSELDELNGGRGVRTGSVQFTNTLGEIFVVDLDDTMQDLGDVLYAINEVGVNFGVQAAINATGDGIVIEDTNGGSATFKIADTNGGSAAEDLRIAGTAAVDETSIDGSFEIVVEVDADDSLQDVAAKIRDASPDLRASVMNDGASKTPYRLSVTSGVTGKDGELLFDAGTTGLKMSTLVAAQDAVVLVGGQGSSPIVVSSSTNTMQDVIPGVEIDLVAVSDERVTVSTGRDVDRVVDDIQTFVDNYNAVMDQIDDATLFDPETESRGPLLGESSVSTVENRLSRALIRRYSAGPTGLQTLSNVGIEFGGGARLSFDEEKFREKFADDPNGVRQLFTGGSGSVGAALADALESLTDGTDGLLTRRDTALSTQESDLTERIEAYDDKLARRRTQLERQYANLESVLAGLQDQQTALSQLAALAG